MARHVLSYEGFICLLACIVTNFLSSFTYAANLSSEMVSAHINASTDLQQPWWQQALAMPDSSLDPINHQESSSNLTSVFTPASNNTSSRNDKHPLKDSLDATTGYLKEQQLPPCCRHTLATYEQQLSSTSAPASSSNCLDFHHLTNQTKPQYDWDGTLLYAITDNNAESSTDVSSNCMSSEQPTIGSLPCCQPRDELLSPEELQDMLITLQDNNTLATAANTKTFVTNNTDYCPPENNYLEQALYSDQVMQIFANANAKKTAQQALSSARLRGYQLQFELSLHKQTSPVDQVGSPAS